MGRGQPHWHNLEATPMSRHHPIIPGQWHHKGLQITSSGGPAHANISHCTRWSQHYSGRSGRLSHVFTGSQPLPIKLMRVEIFCCKNDPLCRALWVGRKPNGCDCRAVVQIFMDKNSQWGCNITSLHHLLNVLEKVIYFRSLFRGCCQWKLLISKSCIVKGHCCVLILIWHVRRDLVQWNCWMLDRIQSLLTPFINHMANTPVTGDENTPAQTLFSAEL